MQVINGRRLQGILKLVLKRLFGLLLIFAAAAGFIFSVVGIAEIWRYKPVVEQKTSETLALGNQMLSTTQDGLTMVGQVVQTTTVDVASLQTAIQQVSQTIHQTNPMMDTLTHLTSKDFPATIDATQTSLTSAQSSALLIDNVMGALTSIPLLPIAPYKPAVPLHTALAQVSASLNSLPPALATINSSLVDSTANLGSVEGELNSMSETTKGIGVALGSSKTIIDQYKTATTQLKLRVEAAQQAAPAWITAAAWILSIFLSWLLIAQLGLCIQGLELLRDGSQPVK